MAEICCELASCGTEAAVLSSCEQGSRGGRQRQVEIRRLRFVVGEEDEPSAKRSRVDRGNHTAAGGSENPPGSSGVCRISESTSRATADDSGPSYRSLRFGMSTVCGRRRDMEDAVSIRPNFARRDDQIPVRFHFFGVFDGHGYSHVRLYP